MPKINPIEIEELAKSIAKQIKALSGDEDTHATIFRALASELGLDHHLRPDCIAPIFSRPELPGKAPQIYRDRANRKENPIEFVRRVYARWIGKGMTHNHLLSIDPSLYWGLRNYCRHHFNSFKVSEHAGLLTKQQLIDEDHAIVVANFSDKASRDALEREIIALRRVNNFLRSRGNEHVADD